MKKIINFFNTIFLKFKIQKSINSYDEKINHKYLEKGFELERNLISFTPNLSKPTSFDEYGFNEMRIINKDLALIASEAMDFFNEKITGYIGKNVRLDDMVLLWFDPSKAKKDSVSGYWHNDHCGNRLKLYICLLGDGKTPTIYLPKTHTGDFRFTLKDIIRFLGFKNKKKLANQHKLDLSERDCSIFDTNGLHRGFYEDGSTERVTLILEFIDRNKSNNIFNAAPTGPGNSINDMIIFNNEALSIMSKNSFFDFNLLNSEGSAHTYSLKNNFKKP